MKLADKHLIQPAAMVRLSQSDVQHVTTTRICAISCLSKNDVQYVRVAQVSAASCLHVDCMILLRNIMRRVPPSLSFQHSLGTFDSHANSHRCISTT